MVKDEILIADDDEGNRLLLEKILSHAGYIVRVAQSSALALRSAKAKQPSLILLDVRMPDMDGYELCRKIKANASTKDTPVIFISASVHSNEIPTGFEMGAVDFILKPFNETEVLARVAAHLTLYHTRQELRLKNVQLLDEAAERTRQENEIKESEFRFNDIFQTIEEGIIYMSPLGTILKVNEALVKLTGITRDRLIGMTALDVIRTFLPLHEITRITPMVISRLQGNPLAPFELDYNNKSLEISVHLSTNSRNLIGFLRDVTGRKKAYDAVKTERTFFNQLIETAPEGIAIIDPQSFIIRVNQEFVRMFGYSSAECIGQNIDNLILPKGYEEESKMLKTDITAGKGTVVETLRRRKDGSLLDVSIMGSPINLEGKHVAVYGIYRDISEQKKVKAKLIEFNAQLEERVLLRTKELSTAYKELDSFSYSVSHDLRTPLRSIEGFSTIFLQEFGNLIPPKGREYLDRVQRNTVRMGDLIDDLLKLSRLSSDHFVTEPVNLSELASQVVKELRANDPLRNVRVEIEPDLKVMADLHLLRIVLTNLLGNAWKFTSKCKDAFIKMGKATNHEFGTAYYVKDNGVGFDPAYKDKLFSAFQRLHSPHEFPGTGIGLATVARIIHRHHGDVWAEGEVDKGATFFFTLPENAPL